MSSKMVPKAYPEEKLGHFCLRGGTARRHRILRPADRAPAGAGRRRPAQVPGRQHRDPHPRPGLHPPDGRGGLGCRSTGPKRRSPTVDASGAPVRPSKPNGVKFEMFVFDALPLAEHPLVVETRRADDFSPVKNAEGVDSPKTCRDDQLRQAARWLRAAGADIPADETGLPPFPVEVSPLFALDEAVFVERWKALRPRPPVAPGLALE